MDRSAPCIDFALIGHQENWEKVSQLVNAMRNNEGIEELDIETIKQIFSYIPPRPVFDIQVNSINNKSVHGVYIETFIAPDQLDSKHLHQNLSKVKEACICATKLGVNIVSLGGFTSIVLETGNASLQNIEHNYFKTGNSLTAAFICEGINKASAQKRIQIADSSLLVIGSTGDIGSACVRYFSRKVKKLLLNARLEKRLQQQADELKKETIQCTASVNLNQLIPEADIIICVASSPVNEWDIKLLKANVIICDAGYPKNIVESLPAHLKKNSFNGGMGYNKLGFHFTPSYMKAFYSYPVPSASHGCLLESIVLSMEKKYEAFSTGRGSITLEKMNTILQMAKKNQIVLSPFFNSEGAW